MQSLGKCELLLHCRTISLVQILVAKSHFALLLSFFPGFVPVIPRSCWCLSGSLIRSWRMWLRLGRGRGSLWLCTGKHNTNNCSPQAPDGCPLGRSASLVCAGKAGHSSRGSCGNCCFFLALVRSETGGDFATVGDAARAQCPIQVLLL